MARSKQTRALDSVLWLLFRRYGDAVPEVALWLGVSGRMVHYWLRGEHLSLARANQFLRAAAGEGLISVEIAMKAHIATEERRRAATRYVQNSILFGECGRWHAPAAVRRAMEADRRKMGTILPAHYATSGSPPKPPAGLTDRQAGIIKPHLEKRGWTLIQDVNGVWQAAPLATGVQHGINNL